MRRDRDRPSWWHRLMHTQFRHLFRGRFTPECCGRPDHYDIVRAARYHIDDGRD